MADVPVAAYVLHRRPYGESSQIVEFFTATHGRVAAIAKGVRAGTRSSLRADPFQRLSIQLRGRGELPLLAACEPLANTPLLTGMASLAGLYLNELLLAVLQRDDPHPQLFEHYAICLGSLAQDLAQALRRFEWQLLSELGYAPDLSHDALGAPLQSDQRYHYASQEGFQVSANGRWSGAMLLALAAGRAESGGAQKAFLREQISLLLDGRRLRSWDLLAEIERSAPPAGDGS